MENNILSEIMLIVDNAPGYPPFNGDLHPHVKVVRNTLNTTFLIQPKDKGVTAVFKAYRLRRTSAQVMAATEEDTYAILEGLQHL